MAEVKQIKDLYVDAFPRLHFDTELFGMLEGNIIDQVIAELQQDIKNKTSFAIAKRRVPYVNIVTQVVEKLSKIYSSSPTRDSETIKDRKLLEELVRDLNVNKTFYEANRMFNCHNRSAIELYYDKKYKEVKPRVLSADKFFVFAKDSQNTNYPDLFVKVLNLDFKKSFSFFNRVVNPISLNSIENLTATLVAYTKDKIEIFNVEKGQVNLDLDLMRKNNLISASGELTNKNVYGFIPFIYCNKSEHLLTPARNEGAHTMSLLIPRMLADLNYAAQFKSHNLIWLRNTHLPEGLKISPDSVIDLGAVEDPNLPNPEIGTLNSQIDVTNQLKLIRYELEAYLTSLGLRVGATEASGFQNANIEGSISSLFDLSDAINVNRKQINKFTIYEKKFWWMLNEMRGFHGLPTFTNLFDKSFSIFYEESKPVKSDMQVLNEVKLLKDIGLIPKRRAVRRIYPDLSIAEIDMLIKELDEEQATKTVEQAVQAGHLSDLESLNGNTPLPNPNFDPNPEQRANKINNFNSMGVENGRQTNTEPTDRTN